MFAKYLDAWCHVRLTGYRRSGEANLTHVYNGMDDRVATTTMPSGGAADTRRFVYAPDGRVLGEYGPNATDVRAEFIWMSPEVGEAGDNLFGGDDGLGGYMPLAVAMADPVSGAGATQLVWVHASHMGVPIRYSNTSGTTLDLPTSYSVPGFPGQSRTLSDLYYNRYRDYDPTTGRYIQADPIGLAGGPEPYGYAMNNPLRYTDSQGLFLDTLADIGFIGYDLYRLGRDNILGDCDNLGENLTALGLDLGATFVPFVTGAGAASRVVARADEMADVVNSVHKNSLSYVGDTYFYAIRGPDGSLYKVGESAQGVRARDGASIRAELQARTLRKETGDLYTTEIRQNFDGKAGARSYEASFIKTYQRLYGKLPPGNLFGR